MAYLGRQGVTAPLTSADIPDNSITTAKIVDDNVTAAKYLPEQFQVMYFILRITHQPKTFLAHTQQRGCTLMIRTN